MAQGKRAKILNPKQENVVLRHLETTRYPERDRVLFLLSMKAGLRAAEIAALSWAMVTDANGQIGDSIALEDKATKGKKGGRDIPLHRGCFAGDQFQWGIFQSQDDRADHHGGIGEGNGKGWRGERGLLASSKLNR